MDKAFMPNFECVNILKNYLVLNMRYGFDVCVVQSERKRENFLNNSFAISASFSNEEYFLIIVITGFNMKTILTDISIT